VNNAVRRLLLLIAVLSLAGVAISSVSLQHHYAKSATAYCDLAENFSCDIVNRSAYSSVMGFPVAGIGIAGYLALLALSTVYRSRVETPGRLLLAALAGLVFALYLTYVEARVLYTWCILCLSSLVVIATISALALVTRVRSGAGHAEG
jgi:uncharacterized membrane protein